VSLITGRFTLLGGLVLASAWARAGDTGCKAAYPDGSEFWICDLHDAGGARPE
jgi:hypothetical protein